MPTYTLTGNPNLLSMLQDLTTDMATVRSNVTTVNPNLLSSVRFLTSNSGLTNANVTNMDLSNMDLRNATLTGVRGRVAAHTDAILPYGYKFINRYIVGPNVNLIDAELEGQDLTGVDLTNVYLIGARLDNVKGQLAAHVRATLSVGYKFINRYIVGRNVDLTNADLEGQDLTGADLTGVDLSNAVLTNATLTNVKGQLEAADNITLSTNYKIANNYIVGPKVDLTDADLRGADLNEADLSNADLTQADLTGATLTNVKGGLAAHDAITLSSPYKIIKDYIVGPSVDLTNADLTGADLTGADLSDATLTNVKGKLAVHDGITLSSPYKIIKDYIVGPGVDLTGVNLSNADLSNADLTNATLTNVKGKLAAHDAITLSFPYKIIKDYIVGPSVDLTGVNFTGANLRYADLTGANLTRADLTEADVRGVKFINANLSYTDFSSISDLSTIRLDGATLNNTISAAEQLPDGYTAQYHADNIFFLVRI